MRLLASLAFLAAENHLSRFDVEPTGEAYRVATRFEFNGMSAFRSWYESDRTEELLEMVDAAARNGTVRYSLVLDRPSELAREG